MTCIRWGVRSSFGKYGLRWLCFTEQPIFFINILLFFPSPWQYGCSHHLESLRKKLNIQMIYKKLAFTGGYSSPLKSQKQSKLVLGLGTSNPLNATEKWVVITQQTLHWNLINLMSCCYVHNPAQAQPASN